MALATSRKFPRYVGRMPAADALAHADYYRRQARNCLQLAQHTYDPAMRGRLALLANEFAGRAAAYEEEAFIISSREGVAPQIPAAM
jgi:hypothetical protein